jgi:hypothetical protein
MGKNIESPSSGDDTSEYRTAEGDSGLIFAEPKKVAGKINNQERVGHSKELTSENIKEGSSAAVWHDIDKDIQRQLKSIDEGKPYNKQLLEDLMAERSILQSMAEEFKLDIKGWNDFIENGGDPADYWRVNLKETPAKKMIPQVEKDLIFLENKRSLSENEQEERETRKRVIEKLGKEAQKTAL